LELKDDPYRYYTPTIRIYWRLTLKNTTRKTLLITAATAALIGGAGLASAQGTSENREAPGAAAHNQKAPEGKMDQHPGSLPPKSPAPTAQAPTKGKPAPTAQAPTKEKPAPTAQAPAVSKPETTGRGSAAQTSESPNPRTAPTAARDEPKFGVPAALSVEQHAKVWNTLHSGKADRLTSVPFSISVGEVVPGTVRLYDLPDSIVEYAPQYRDYEYILVGDDILIVDPRTMRIVAVIAA
jgi:hypothetical protein